MKGTDAMKRSVLGLALGAFFVCGAVSSETVLFDLGGLIVPRGEHVEALAEADEPVEILGICHSACTMFLGLPKVCVAPDANIMFHGPYNILNPFASVPEDQYKDAVRFMASHYPDPIAAWFRAVGHSADHYVDGQTLIDLGVNSCDR